MSARRRSFLALVATAVLLCAGAGGPAPARGNSLPVEEEVVQVPKPAGPFIVELEATVFKPPGEGPFPLVVINHGKARGRPAFQARARYAAQSAEFVRRGYVVIVPMRQGFAKSGGPYIGGGCNATRNGLAQAEDVVAALDYMRTQPYVDMSRIIVIGQSHGGLTTMAFATLNYPGVRGVINFSGGLRDDACAGWQSDLVETFAGYGRLARYPSLWLYGDNDSYWPPPLPDRMFEAYRSEAQGAAADTRLVDYGSFEDDAHRLFGSRAGIPVWLPEVASFFRELGLPFDPLP